MTKIFDCSVSDAVERMSREPEEGQADGNGLLGIDGALSIIFER